MHSELRFYIQEALTSAFIGEVWGSEVQGRLDISKILVEVHDCPPEIDSVLMCPVCFDLAKQLESILGREVFPVEVSQELVKRLSENTGKCARYFDTVVGGPGYINAQPTNEFVNCFINVLASQGVEKLCSEAPLTVESFTERELCKQRKEEIGKIRYSSERYRTSDNEDVRMLIERKGGNVKANDWLMLLALLADSDLKVEPYLKGLFGVENVPWFFNRFLDDAKMFSAKIRDRFVVRLPVALARESFPLSTWSSVEQLLRYRYVVKSALSLHREEVIVAYLLRLVRGFYRYYNHPMMHELRADICDYAGLAIVVEMMASLVKQTLNLLDLEDSEAC